MKQPLSFFLNLYINSSLHVALAVVSFSLITFQSFKIPIDFVLLLFIFFGTITGYNFIKYASIAGFQQDTVPKTIRLIQLFSLLTLLGAIITSFFLPLLVIIVAFIMGGFTFLYALPVFSHNRNLRGIPGIKIYVIAFVVAGVTVLMPVLNYSSLLNRDISLEFLQRMLIAVALILPFELRDLKYDNAILGTIPQRLGIGATKKLGYSITAGFVALEFFKQNIQIAYLIGLFFLAVITITVIRISKVEQKPYFASFYVEAIPIAWMGVLYFTQYIIL